MQIVTERTLAGQLDQTALKNRIDDSASAMKFYNETGRDSHLLAHIVCNQMAIMRALVDLTTVPVVRI